MQQKGLRLLALQQVNNRLLKPSYLGLFLVHAILAAWCCAHQGLGKVQKKLIRRGGWHFCSSSLTNLF